MRLFSPFLRAHGLDISDLKIRALEATREKKGISIHGFAQQAIPPGVINEGEIQNYDKVREILRHLYKSVTGRFSSPFVVISVPERRTYSKVIDIETLPESQLNDAIRWEAEQHFPVSPDNMYVSWSLIQTEKDRQRILLSATERAVVDQYIALLEDVGKYVIIAEPESLSVQRSLLFDDPTPTTIIDLGASKTSVDVCTNGIIHYTSTISFSGRELTNTVAEKLNLTFDQAERAKQMFGMSKTKSKGVVRKILTPLFEVLITHIKDVHAYYESHYPTLPPIQRLVITGGGAGMENSANYIAEEIGLPGEIKTPLILQKKAGKNFPKEAIPSFSTSIGLALRSSEQKPFDMLR